MKKIKLNNTHNVSKFERINAFVGVEWEYGSFYFDIDVKSKNYQYYFMFFSNQKQIIFDIQAQ